VCVLFLVSVRSMKHAIRLVVLVLGRPRVQTMPLKVHQLRHSTDSLRLTSCCCCCCCCCCCRCRHILINIRVILSYRSAAVTSGSHRLRQSSTERGRSPKSRGMTLLTPVSAQIQCDIILMMATMIMILIIVRRRRHLCVLW
jgi:hypothetical protein